MCNCGCEKCPECHCHDSKIKAEFRKELQELINRHSKENESNTPDFILAEYLNDCLAAWNKNVMRRSDWYGNVDKIQTGKVS